MTASVNPTLQVFFDIQILQTFPTGAPLVSIVDSCSTSEEDYFTPTEIYVDKSIRRIDRFSKVIDQIGISLYRKI